MDVRDDESAALFALAMEQAGLAESPDAWRGANLAVEMLAHTVSTARRVADRDGAEEGLRDRFAASSMLRMLAGIIQKTREMIR